MNDQLHLDTKKGFLQWPEYELGWIPRRRKAKPQQISNHPLRLLRPRAQAGGTHLIGIHGTSAIGKTISGLIIGKNGTKLKCAIEFVKAPGNCAQWLHQELQAHRKQRVLTIILSLLKVLVQKLLRLGFKLSQQQQPWVRRRCRHYAHPVARRHTFLVHAPQHMLRTFHVAQVWQKVSVFGSSCVMSLLSLPRSTSSLPDYFVLTTSTYFSTFSVPPHPQHGAGVTPQEHPLAGGSLADWPTRLHTQEWWKILEHKETCCKYTNHHYMQKVF